MVGQFLGLYASEYTQYVDWWIAVCTHNFRLSGCLISKYASVVTA